jgi:histone-binding protein RBBP4
VLRFSEVFSFCVKRYDFVVILLFDLSRWGPQLEQAGSKTQRLYLSEQTNGSVPNTLVIANCETVNRQLNEKAHSPFVKKYKTIIHPGEVNRIRELPQNSKIVATHTDSPDILIWNTETQPDRYAVLGAPDSRPDLVCSCENFRYVVSLS